MQNNINNAIEDNKAAQTLGEWESSEAHPEKIFASWRESYESDPAHRGELTDSVCSSLSERSAQDLTVFDNELNDPINDALLVKCKRHLLKRADQFYVDQRYHLEVSTDVLRNGSYSSELKNDFSFKDNLQKRDVSHGYYAVSGDVEPKEIILTFDDGPSAVYTPSILSTLKEVNAKVIFFELGKNVRANPDTTRAVAAEGHSIGSHSTTHACLGSMLHCLRISGRYLSFDEATAEIVGGHQAIYDTLGWVDPFFRFPYGEVTPELRSYLQGNGMGEFFWAVDSEDWKSSTNQEMINKVLTALEPRKRGVILFHDIQRKTAESLPQILRELYNRGYSLVLLQAADPTARYNPKIVKKRVP
jgi:peptidoglycan/xylan/chitin deacetylase (PgdA/CDA1 family)